MTTNDAITTQLAEALRKAQAALDSVAQPRSLQAEALADVDDALAAYDALTSQPSGEVAGSDLIHRIDTALSGDGDLDLDAVVALLRECQDVVKHLRRDDWTITDLSVGDACTAALAPKPEESP